MTGRHMWATLASVIVVGAGGAGVVLRSTPPPEAAAAARRGRLEVVVTESGVLRAASSVTFRSPVEGRELEIRWLAPEGSQVRAGELVATLDTSGLQVDLDRATQMARQVEMELAAARVEREEAALALRGATEGAGLLAVEEGRTELQLLQARAKRLRDEQQRLEPLLAKGYVTREEFDRAGLDADEADARAMLGERAYRILAERTHPASVQAARLQLARRDAQLANLTPRLDAARAYVGALVDQIRRCAIRASHPGLVMYEDNHSVAPRRKIRVGDRVTPSQGIVTLPDLRRMTVESSVRESDVRTIAPGQRVRVTLDAFPNLVLEGTVAHLGALAQAGRDGDSARFDLTIQLNAVDARLRPAMNARADIVTAEHADALLVPIQAVFQDENGAYVFVRRRGAIERRRVRTGPSNAVETQIVEGLAAGDRVLLAVPEARHDPR